MCFTLSSVCVSIQECKRWSRIWQRRRQESASNHAPTNEVKGPRYGRSTIQDAGTAYTMPTLQLSLGECGYSIGFRSCFFYQRGSVDSHCLHGQATGPDVSSCSCEQVTPRAQAIRDIEHIRSHHLSNRQPGSILPFFMKTNYARVTLFALYSKSPSDFDDLTLQMWDPQSNEFLARMHFTSTCFLLVQHGRLWWYGVRLCFESTSL